jgi:hypothetical protein
MFSVYPSNSRIYFWFVYCPAKYLYGFYLSSNILSFRQYILAPTNIVNHSIFWLEVLLIQNFAFLISYHFILMFVFSILYSKSCKYLQLFSAHSASMTSMQLLPVVIIQYAKYEINHLELD